MNFEDLEKTLGRKLNKDEQFMFSQGYNKGYNTGIEQVIVMLKKWRLMK